MTPKLSGAALADGDQHCSPPLPKGISDRELTPVPGSIRWTQVSRERFAATRRDRIAVVAYHMYEARGFAPGHDAEDWLLAQAQVDATDAHIFDE